MNTTSHFSKFPPERSLKGAGAKIPWNSEQALISSLIEVVYSQRRESYYTSESTIIKIVSYVGNSVYCPVRRGQKDD